MNKQLLEYLDAISKIVIILGFPIAFFQYMRTKRKEKRDREYGTYNALDEKYLEFQKLCLEHPYLNIFDVPDEKPTELDNKKQKEELILFTMLFSIFERAYLLYFDQYSDIKKSNGLVGIRILSHFVKEIILDVPGKKVERHLIRILKNI